MNFANTKAAGYLALGAVGLVALYFIWRKTAGAVSAAASATAATVINSDPNAGAFAGTDYAGTGPIGALGGTVNAASGGILDTFGNWLGGKLADLTMPYDPNAPATPNTAPATASSTSATTRDQAVLNNYVSTLQP